MIALFERFSELREGDMSRLRANLVRQATSAAYLILKNEE